MYSKFSESFALFKKISIFLIESCILFLAFVKDFKFYKISLIYIFKFSLVSITSHVVSSGKPSLSINLLHKLS